MKDSVSRRPQQKSPIGPQRRAPQAALCLSAHFLPFPTMLRRAPFAIRGIPQFARPLDAAFDRAAALRRDPDALRALAASADARFVLAWRGRSLVAVHSAQQRTVAAPYRGRGSVVPQLLSAEELRRVFPDAATSAMFLGRSPQHAYFAVDLSSAHAGDPCEPGGPLADHLPDGRRRAFVDLRLASPALADGLDAHLLAYARALSYWHHTHRHCATCGAKTRVEQWGHVRTCSSEACGKVWFPRTDPAVIALVEDEPGKHVLLGRHATWPPGLYSTLAGFVEAGESLEQAVAREVQEEAGVTVGDCWYAGSQPWPFPRSLMLAYFARATGGEAPPVTVDPRELQVRPAQRSAAAQRMTCTPAQDARWFSREQLLRVVGPKRSAGVGGADTAAAGGGEEGTLRAVPPRSSIARQLIEGWLEGQEEARGRL